MHTGMMTPNLYMICIVHPSMGMTAMNVVMPAADTAAPSLATASSPLSPLA